MNNADIKAYFKENYVKELTFVQKMAYLILWLIFFAAGISLFVALIIYGKNFSGLFMISVVTAIPAGAALIFLENWEKKREILKRVPYELLDECVDEFVASLSKRFAEQFENVLFADYVYLPFTVNGNPKYFCSSYIDTGIPVYYKICEDGKHRTSRFTARTFNINNGILTINDLTVDLLTEKSVASTKELRLLNFMNISFGSTYEEKFLQLGTERFSFNNPLIGNVDEVVEEVKKWVLINNVEKNSNVFNSLDVD